ncbi:hypothetical protein EMIT0158MI4_160202 [Burkholderia ambifaria]
MYDQSRLSDAERNARSTTLLPGLSGGSWAAGPTVAGGTIAPAGAEDPGETAGPPGVAWAVARQPASRATANGRASRRMANRFRKGARYRSSGA